MPRFCASILRCRSSLAVNRCGAGDLDKDIWRREGCFARGAELDGLGTDGRGIE